MMIGILRAGFGNARSGERKEFSRVAARGVLPEPSHRLDRFSAARGSSLPGNAERLELLFHPADPHAENESAAAHEIQRGRELRKQ